MSEEKKPDISKCPQCDELLVFPRGQNPYCEECGWPDEDFDDESKAPLLETLTQIATLRARIAELEKRAVKILYPPFAKESLPKVGDKLWVRKNLYEISGVCEGILWGSDLKLKCGMERYTIDLRSITSIVLLPDLTNEGREM